MNRLTASARAPYARITLLALLILAASCATTHTPPQWPDSYQSRVEALALLQTFNADVLAASSATATLERWCGDHRMADPARIVARLEPGAYKAPSGDQLRRLGVTDASEVKYRRVRLQCGAHTLSIADNWYVPARLTKEMNDLLERTDTPFGRAVSELKPYRRTIEAKLLWSPLPSGWELQRRPRRHDSGDELQIPAEVLVHNAVLYTAQHQPFSEVIETYQGALFDFAR